MAKGMAGQILVNHRRGRKLISLEPHCGSIFKEKKHNSNMQNPLDTYEAAIEKIAQSSDQGSFDEKHRAVLALVRAGSLDFALSEYARYGLGEIRNHEDIMGLGGRLYKDLHLSHTGRAAKEFARLSAEKYEEAYQDTGGYYSGINAATMSLLGGIPAEIVEMRARRILDGLPDIDNLLDDEIYFSEATRAEAWLLLGDMHRAQAAFRRALDFDPLNYTAHASTLKQFKMIAKAREEAWPWLSEFVPPKAMHMAGHIFGREGDVADVPVLSKSREQELADQISNHIQENDIGFAYGALAAGTDVLIAEAILEEGGELHVVLPANKKAFIAKSVEPYGHSWVRRFNACIKQASSVTIFDGNGSWPDPMMQQRASLIAMGTAIRKSSELSVDAVQLLVWDGKKGRYGTAKDAATWKATGRPQFSIPYPDKRNAKPHVTGRSGFYFEAALQGSDGSSVQTFRDLRGAVLEALANRNKVPDLAQAICYELKGPKEKGEKEKDNIADLQSFGALPGAIHVCELAANYLSVFHGHEFQTDFIGISGGGERIFALRERG